MIKGEFEKPVDEEKEVCRFGIGMPPNAAMVVHIVLSDAEYKGKRLSEEEILDMLVREAQAARVRVLSMIAEYEE